MNRTILLTAAALLSAALVGLGCEHERSSSHSSSRSSSSASARPGSARGETMEATGTAGIGAKRGTGTTASGTTTGNVSVGATADSSDPGSVSIRRSSDSGTASASASASGQSSTSSAEATSDTATDQRQRPAAQRSTSDTTGAAASATATDDAGTGTTVGVGPTGATLTDTTDTTDSSAVAAADKDKDAHHGQAAAVAHVKPAQAAPKDMQVSGTVKFMPVEHGVKVMVDLKGLTPNGKHGFHIHEKGDLSDPKLMSVGPHFNPTGKKHGGPEGEERHGGDLGNLTADAKGNVKTEIMAHGVTIDGEKDGVLGRSVIVHAKADDLKTDPSGNSGDRIAGGVIEKHKKGDKSAADAGASTDSDARTAAEKESAEQPAPEDQELNK